MSKLIWQQKLTRIYIMFLMNYKRPLLTCIQVHRGIQMYFEEGTFLQPLLKLDKT